MVHHRQIILTSLVATALLAGSGCVTKKTFRKNVESTDGRVTSVESAVEANERRIGDLKQETDGKITHLQGQTDRAMQTGTQALSKAETAEITAQKAAAGKLLWSMKLSDDKVKFGFGRAGLGPEAKSMLNELASQVKSYGKAVYMEIEGHTDNVGDESYNVSLGELRAMAVRNYLSQEGGIPLHAMNTISYGSSQPVADNTSGNGRAQNRRVVVKVLE